MATAIGSLISRTLILDQKDYTNETGRVEIPLDGTLDDAGVVAIVDNYIASANSLITPTIKDLYSFTGYATAGRPKNGTNPQALLALILAMEFQKTSPINAAKTLTKQILLPAYLDALRNDSVTPHIPVTGNATFNNLVGEIAASLDIVLADGAHYPGGWTFNPGSKFGSKLTVTDGE